MADKVKWKEYPKKEYPKKLFIFEMNEFLADVKEVQGYLKTHTNIDKPFLAYAFQFNRYNSDKMGIGIGGEGVNEGELFGMLYKNDETFRGMGRKKRKYLASAIELYGPEKIFSIREEQLEKNIEKRYREVIEAPRSLDSGRWTWIRYYPYMSIAVLSLPELIQEIEAAGVNIGAETKVYRHMQHRIK